MSKKLFWVGAATLLAFTTHAQQPDSVATRLLDEVTITANRILQKQSQTGKVISVINQEQIARSSGRTVAQLLNEQAGIVINGALNNMGTNQTLYMRGANSGRTLILVDGIPAYDPSFINNDFDLNLFSLNDVERIEICRGAQSTLYGSDAIAGVINIITVKSNIANPVNLKATASYGSFNTLRTNLQAYGKINKFTYTARYARLSTDGFSAAYDSTGTKGYDDDGYTGNAFTGAVQYQVSDKWLVKSFVQHNRYQSDVDASAFNDEKDFTINNKNLMAGTGFHFRNNGFSLTGNYQYSELSRNYLNDSIDVPGFSKYSSDNHYGRNQYLELFTNIELTKGLSAVYGVDYRFSNMNNQFLSISSFGPFTSGFRDTSVSQASMYGSLLFSKSGFNIELGGRLNVHDRYGSNATYTFNPSYAFNPHFRIFGSIATGFKAPSLFQMYSSFGNLQLKAEESKNYELGIQQTHKRIANRVVYFHRNIDNGLDFDNNSFRYFNIVKQIVRGIEAESAATITKDLKITFNYTHIASDETAQSRISFADTTYSYLLRRPKHTLNASIGWQATSKLYASITTRYISERFDVAGYKVPDARLDPYMLLGAYADYTFNSKFKIFVDAQNVLNKKFFDLRGYNSMPVNIQGGITVNL